jgi:hypothetical protein
MKDTKKFQDSNENVNTTDQNLQDTAKAVFREQSTAMSTLIRKLI